MNGSGTMAAAYSADALLRDGTSVHIRAIRPDDKQRLQDHFHRLGPESVYYRFFGAKNELSDRDLRYFTELDFDQHVGLVALRRVGDEEQFLGVGRYIRSRDAVPPLPRAEMAVAVADTEQGHGLGTLLLEHLARLAARAGVTELVAQVLPSNHRMVEMLRHSGFVQAGSTGTDVSSFVLPTAETEAVTQHRDQRA